MTVGSEPLGGEALSGEVWALFRALDHAGDPDDSGRQGQWLCGQAGSEQHGTRVRFALCLQGRRVLEARYRAYGCPHTLATCEWLATELQGRELAAVSADGLARAVGGPLQWRRRLAVPEAKLGRLLVIEDALRAALGSGCAPF